MPIYNPASGLDIPFFNVVEYGADPTGVNDSTGAIQAAINAAAPKSYGAAGTVFFPPGIYLVSSPLTVGPYLTGSTVPVSYPSLVALSSNGLIGDGDSVSGSSPGAVTLRATASFPAQEYLLTYNAPNNNVAPAGSWIKGISVDCNSLAAGVKLWQPRQFHIEDLTIAHADPVAGYGAFDVDQYNASAGWRNYFEKVYVQYSTADGIRHAADDFATYISPTVQNATRYGYNIAGGSGAWINPNYFQGSGSANVAAIAAACGGSSLLYMYGFAFVGSGPGSGGPNIALQVWGQGGINHLPAIFESCAFENGPASGTGESAGSNVWVQDAQAGNSCPVKFRGCSFFAGPYTTDWVYVDAGVVAGDLVTYEGCSFHGSPITHQFNDASGNNLLRFRNCDGINPTGAQTAPTVPASGTALANPFPFDCTVAITGTCTVTVGGIEVASISGGPSPVFVGAGQTITLTYTTAPTWAWTGH